LPLAFAFAAIAGYADAIGYLQYKAFAGMMTGNTVLMGLAFFHRADLPVGEYAAVLAIFFVTSAIAYAALRNRRPPAVLLVAEAIALLLPEIIPGRWAIVPLVIAMGLQNPPAQRLGPALSTTFITGDILRFAEGVIGRIDPALGLQARGTFRDLRHRLAGLCGRRGVGRGEFRNIALAADRAGRRARFYLRIFALAGPRQVINIWFVTRQT
jgi:Protein of unknown function (DUF1275)